MKVHVRMGSLSCCTMGARGVERFAAVRHIGVCRGDAPHMIEPVVLTDQCEKAMPGGGEVLKLGWRWSSG